MLDYTKNKMNQNENLVEIDIRKLQLNARIEQFKSSDTQTQSQPIKKTLRELYINKFTEYKKIKCSNKEYISENEASC